MHGKENGTEVLTKRKAELDRLWKEGKPAKRIQEAVHSAGIHEA